MEERGVSGSGSRGFGDVFVIRDEETLEQRPRLMELGTPLS